MLIGISGAFTFNVAANVSGCKYIILFPAVHFLSLYFAHLLSFPAFFGLTDFFLSSPLPTLLFRIIHSVSILFIFILEIVVYDLN